MISNNSRLAYLQAMGVDVWVPRDEINKKSEISTQPEILESARSISEPAQETSIALNEQWQTLQKSVVECRACVLCESRTQTVFGVGHQQADWMLIGEAPGYNEDQQGQPFVGRAGLLLTEMLRAIGLTREQVFIANILKCRPPENRDPKPSEIESCSDYLEQQIKLVKPKIILALGRFAAQNLLKTDQPLRQLRGKVQSVHNTPVIIIYHPAYLLRSLSEKSKAWEDLKLAVQIYRNIEI